MYPMAKCLPTKVILLRSYTAISLFQSNVFFYIVVLLIASVCSFRIERCYLKLQSSVYIDIGKLERERESGKVIYESPMLNDKESSISFLFRSIPFRFWFALGNSVWRWHCHHIQFGWCQSCLQFWLAIVCQFPGLPRKGILVQGSWIYILNWL